MTKLLEEAIAEIRKLPDAEQDLAAEMLLSLVHRGEDHRLTSEQKAEVEGTLRRIDDGTMEFASEEEMTTVWRRFSP